MFMQIHFQLVENTSRSGRVKFNKDIHFTPIVNIYHAALMENMVLHWLLAASGRVSSSTAFIARQHPRHFRERTNSDFR